MLKDEFLKKLLNSCNLLKENEQYLGELDAKFGDGDHGITMTKIANTMTEIINNNNKDKSLQDIFGLISDGILNMGAGSASSLWGMLFLGFKEGTNEEINIKQMFISSYEKLRIITQALVGDKTLMDAFLPGYEVAIKDGSLEEIVDAIVNGANNTSNFIAKYGRAKNYKEQSIGTCDPGAISLSIFFKGLL